jgi:hypothetical protein
VIWNNGRFPVETSSKQGIERNILATLTLRDSLQWPLLGDCSCPVNRGYEKVQRRKFAAAILAVLLFGIIAPMAIPRGHADDYNETLTSSGYVIRNHYDPYLGSYVSAIKSGNTLEITVVFQADSSVMQRNVSMGIKFDYMTSFQNSSMASPQSPYTIFANQIAYLTLNYTIPNLTGGYSGLNLSPHSFIVEVWNGPSGQTWTNGCGYGYTEEFYGYVGVVYKYLGSCHEFYNGGIAIYSSAQTSATLADQQAAAEITALDNSLHSVLQAPPGSSNAVAMLASASVQLSLGDTAYSNGDFSGAQTDYQNALNDANAAQSSLATTGGGTDTATLTSIWIETVAILFGGIGALLVGFAGFKYLRARARTISGSSSYSPVNAPKP